MYKSEMLNHIAELSDDNVWMRECLKKIANIKSTVLPDGLTTTEKHAILLGKAIGIAHKALGYTVK